VPFSYLVRLFVLLALLLAPLGMMNTHAAMAMPAAATDMMPHHDMAQAPGGHCADTAAPMGQQPADDSSPANSAECMLACACVPPAIAQVAEQLPFIAPAFNAPDLPLLTGLSRQAELRPPKLS
jgi:hypothetical protein